MFAPGWSVKHLTLESPGAAAVPQGSRTEETEVGIPDPACSKDPIWKSDNKQNSVKSCSSSFSVPTALAVKEQSCCSSSEKLKSS